MGIVLPKNPLQHTKDTTTYNFYASVESTDHNAMMIRAAKKYHDNGTKVRTKTNKEIGVNNLKYDELPEESDEENCKVLEGLQTVSDEEIK